MADPYEEAVETVRTYCQDVLVMWAMKDYPGPPVVLVEELLEMLPEASATGGPT